MASGHLAFLNRFRLRSRQLIEASARAGRKLEESSYLAPDIIKSGVLLLLYFTCLINTGFFFILNMKINSLQGRTFLD